MTSRVLYLIFIPLGLLFGVEWISTIYFNQPLYNGLTVLVISVGVFISIVLLSLFLQLLFCRNHTSSMTSEVIRVLISILLVATVLFFNRSLIMDDLIGFAIFSGALCLSQWLLEKF